MESCIHGDSFVGNTTSCDNQSNRLNTSIFLILWAHKMIICVYIVLVTQASVSQAISQSVPEELILSVQKEFCGTRVCTQDDNYRPPLCSSKDKNTPKEKSHLTQMEPPCRPCSCDADCVIYGNCCVDKNIGGEYRFNCYEVLHHNDQGYAKTFAYVVANCPPDAPQYTREVADKCENGELGHVQDGRMVSSPHEFNTRVAFRNRYCAECHGVQNFTSWDVFVTCKSGYKFHGTDYTDINSLIRAVNVYPHCVITTAYPDENIIGIKNCNAITDWVSTCNETGNWMTYNSSVELACGAYLNPVREYRNIFCAMCNGIGEDVLICPDSHGYEPSITQTVMPFSAILNFERSDMEVVSSSVPGSTITRIGKQQKHQCRSADIYDQFWGTCREKYCPLSSEHEANDCTQLISTQEHVLTPWKVEASMKDLVFNPQDSTSIGSEIVSSLGEIVEDIGFTIFNRGFSDYGTVHSETKLVVSKSHIDLTLLLKPKHRLDLARQKLRSIAHLHLNITLIDGVKLVEVVPVKIHSNVDDLIPIPVFVPPIPIKSSWLMTHIDVPLEFSLSCTILKFGADEVSEVNDSITIHNDTFISNDDYFTNYKNEYYTCLDSVYRKVFIPGNVTQTPVSPDFQIQQILTFVCFVVSLVFLLLTFLIYALLKELHTVPGINLLLLVSSLFLAQITYLLGAGAVSHPPTCTVIGIAIHYLWLVSFAWMCICCVHMFRVFRDVFSSLSFADARKCILLKYSAFAFGVPLIIVLATILTHYYISDNSYLGYGGPYICFVESGLTSILTFGLPVACVMLTNTALLILTMTSLRRNAASQVNRRRSGVKDITRFFKLSTITGLSWIFGFLGQILNRVELMYIFIVLTGTQGLFIFISFAFSRHVWNLIKVQLSCFNKGKNSSNATRSTVDHSKSPSLSVL